jgi:hypothetical protein
MVDVPVQQANFNVHHLNVGMVLIRPVIDYAALPINGRHMGSASLSHIDLNQDSHQERLAIADDMNCDQDMQQGKMGITETVVSDYPYVELGVHTKPALERSEYLHAGCNALRQTADSSSSSVRSI